MKVQQIEIKDDVSSIFGDGIGIGIIFWKFRVRHQAQKSKTLGSTLKK